MILKDVMAGIEYSSITNLDTIAVDEIAVNTKKIDANKATLFVCVAGKKIDGHNFIHDAINNGAEAILIDKEVDVKEYPQNVTFIKVNDTRKVLSHIVSNIEGWPSESIKMIGITGTNGKTSVASLIEDILRRKEKSVGIIGTVGNLLNGKVIPVKKTNPTTPDCVELGKILRFMADGNAEYGVMEVSSMGLELDRVKSLNFELGIFTNLSPDHLDDHGTMENYKNAKFKLFEQCKKAVINIDDPVGYELANEINIDKVTIGIDNEEADLSAKNVKISSKGTYFDIFSNGKKHKCFINIPGRFSVYNALSAIGGCAQIGINVNDVINLLSDTKQIAGRFEVVEFGNENVVVVDYAHTPDALENVLLTAREFTKGKLISVFGCGGDRDPSKRAPMGEISTRFADYSIITSDNPRTEDPEQIIEDIEKGVNISKAKYSIEADRQRAIETAISMLNKGDTIIIAGKGHENYQEIDGKKHYFDDREIVKSIRNLILNK